jgi:hypothetical protein
MAMMTAPLEFVAKPTAMDLALASAAMYRTSSGSILLGTAIIVMPVPGLLIGIPFGLGELISMAFGISLLTGWFAVPFIVFAARRRADLVLATYEVRADEAGVDVRTPHSSVHHDWSTFRNAAATAHGFLLQTGVGATLIPRRGLDPATAKAFGALLRDHGLLPTRKTPLNVAILVLIGIGLGLLPFLVGSGAISL